MRTETGKNRRKVRPFPNQRGPHIFWKPSKVTFCGYIPVVGGRPIRFSLGTSDQARAERLFRERLAAMQSVCEHSFVCTKCGVTR